MKPRPVDAAARSVAAKAIRRWIGGELTNDQFEAEYPSQSKDPAIREIFWDVWATYDDLHEHRFEGPEEVADELELLARFLDTDRPFVHRSMPGVVRALLLIALPVSLLLQVVTFGQFGRWIAPRPSSWPFASVEDEVDARRNLGRQ